MIEVRGLTRAFGDFVAVDGVDFTVHKGEVVGFLGPNGAGKTTTMKVLTGVLEATAGEVSIGGHDVCAAGGAAIAARRLVGYLPESTPLYGELLVYDYLWNAGVIQGVARRDLDARVRRVCAMCGLKDRIAQRVDTLSKGYKQRVGLAQALIHDPPVLILDEPTSGLDPNQIVEIRELIKRLGQERTIILSTHNLPEVMATCTRILIIHKGRIVADGTAEALERREREQMTLTVKLVGAADADVRGALAGVKGVQSVALSGDRRGGDEQRFHVVCAVGGDPRGAIFEVAKARGWMLVGLEQHVLDLESLFRKLTREV